MRILSKKHKPIKSYRKYSKILIFIFFVVDIIILCLSIIAKEYVYLLVLPPLFLWVWWAFNAEFEIYSDRFAVGYSFVILPCKLIITEIFFDDIDWVDRRVAYRRGYEKLIMIVYCKNGAIKEREFKGGNWDFNDVLNNWKEIANYETNNEEMVADTVFRGL
jgi:hypothetical protein